MQPKVKIIPYKLPDISLEVTGAAIMQSNDNTFFCIVIIICIIWITQENDRYGYHFYLSKIQKLPFKAKHQVSVVLAIPSVKQWTGRVVYKIPEVYNEEMHESK